jgi:predicted component of type VI protein secretion system
VLGDNGQLFTISCNDFEKLFDALSALNIGNEVSEKSINKTILDDVENIFNIYAGNCSQLDEYEFE